MVLFFGLKSQNITTHVYRACFCGALGDYKSRHEVQGFSRYYRCRYLCEGCLAQQPTVKSDNCPPRNGKYPSAQEEARQGLSGNVFPQVIDKYDATSAYIIGHTGPFPPGTFEVAYSPHDSNGNAYPHECKVEIEVGLESR